MQTYASAETPWLVCGIASMTLKRNSTARLRADWQPISTTTWRRHSLNNLCLTCTKRNDCVERQDDVELCVEYRPEDFQAVRQAQLGLAGMLDHGKNSFAWRELCRLVELELAQWP